MEVLTLIKTNDTKIKMWSRTDVWKHSTDKSHDKNE